MEDGATPLFQASQEGHADLCTTLLERKANVNKKMEDGAISLLQAE